MATLKFAIVGWLQSVLSLVIIALLPLTQTVLGADRHSVEHFIRHELGGLCTLSKADRYDTPLDTGFVIGDFNGDGRPDLAMRVRIEDMEMFDNFASVRALTILKPLGSGMLERKYHSRLTFDRLERRYLGSTALLIVHGTGG